MRSKLAAFKTLDILPLLTEKDTAWFLQKHFPPLMIELIELKERSLKGLLEDFSDENLELFLEVCPAFKKDSIDDKRFQQIFDKLLEPEVTWKSSQLKKMLTFFIQMDPDYHKEHLHDVADTETHIKGATLPPISSEQAEKIRSKLTVFKDSYSLVTARNPNFTSCKVSDRKFITFTRNNMKFLEKHCPQLLKEI
jgi:hypothetical protein